MNKLEHILNALLKNGLKILPKKCQLFKTSLQYMGNEIFIANKKGMCETIKKQAGSHTETSATKNTQRMQMLCRDSEFPQHVLPRATETPQTHI